MSTGPSFSTKDNTLEYFVKALINTAFYRIFINCKRRRDFDHDFSKRTLDYLSETFEEGSEAAQALSLNNFSLASEASESNGEAEAHFIHLKNTKIYCGDSKSTPSKGKIFGEEK